MFNAASTFLDALSPSLREQANYPLTHEERENWNFVPLSRRGVPLRDLDEPQRERALSLLRSGLSHAGMSRAEAVISLELVLKELEGGSARRNPGLYYVTIFGAPSAERSWGWRFEGHHLSFNFTVVDGAHVFFAPSFIGSNPAEVRSGPRQGERILREEEDLAFALVNSLDPGQRRIAIIADKAPNEIFTTNAKRVNPLEPAGIATSALSSTQREKLYGLVKLYFGRWRAELADKTWTEITAAGLDRIHFAWAGSLTRGTPAYYRIQGPTFLIEFDNSQNGANHIHTTVREFNGDFGHDALRAHYAREHTQ